MPHPKNSVVRSGYVLRPKAEGDINDIAEYLAVHTGLKICIRFIGLGVDEALDPEPG